MKKIPVIPDCYKDLPGSTLLNSRDVASIFKYKGIDALFTCAKNGYIPKPDITRGSDLRNGAVTLNYWKLSTIRNWGKVE